MGSSLGPMLNKDEESSLHYHLALAVALPTVAVSVISPDSEGERRADTNISGVENRLPS